MPEEMAHYTMTDRWFDEYTYQIVVNRKYLPKEVLEAYEQEPIVLKPWGPDGIFGIRGKRKSRFFQEKILPAQKRRCERKASSERNLRGAFL